jgi:hypothetical protein
VRCLVREYEDGQARGFFHVEPKARILTPREQELGLSQLRWKYLMRSFPEDEQNEMLQQGWLAEGLTKLK